MNSYIYNISDMTEAEYLEYYNKMNSIRKAKVDRLKFKDDKMRTVAGEMLLRKVLNREFEIKVSDNGKPYSDDLEIEFNISHSGRFVALAINNSAVGIDIEEFRKVNLKLAKRICNDNELKYIFGYMPQVSDFDRNDDQLIRRFFEIWTFKEAYFKYLGTGITDFSKVDYFDCSLNREQIITDEYIVQIVF